MRFLFRNRKKHQGDPNSKIEGYRLLLLPGVPKCGTSSMFSDIIQFENVISHDSKEINLPLDDKILNTVWFEKVNPEKIDANKGWLIDASQNYCWDLAGRDLEYLSRKQFQEIKVILMFRNPIYRAISNYEMNKKQNGWKDDFKDAWKTYCNEKGQRIMGDYPGVYKRNCRLFGTDNVKVVISEPYFQNRIEVLDEIKQFLGFEGDVSVFKQEVISPMNPEPMQYELDRDLYQQLRAFFEKRIREFEQYTGIHTNWRE